MIDRRSSDEKKQAAQACFERCKERGVTCAGCHLDFYCPMAEEVGRWLVEVFLPAIDPAGTLRR